MPTNQIVQIQTNKEIIEIKPPVISEETMKSMAKFFMQTSIPRILAERKKLAKEQPTT